MDINTIKEFLENNEEIFNNAIEELDGWNGYLNDDRYYDMSSIEDLFCDCSVLDLIDKGATGRDECGNCFNLSRDYFYFDGYGNLKSTDYKDYSAFLDDYFINELIDNKSHLYLDNELLEMLDELEEE